MIVDNFKTVSPAYGRDYKSAKLAQADFLEGKDFILHDIFSRWDGKPCSIRDFAKGAKVEVRYRRLASLTIVTVP